MEEGFERIEEFDARVNLNDQLKLYAKQMILQPEENFKPPVGLQGAENLDLLIRTVSSVKFRKLQWPSVLQLKPKPSRKIILPVLARNPTSKG